MTVALIDDQLLGEVLRDRRPRPLRNAEIYTTGYWYVRLCQAVLGAQNRRGVLSGPFEDLSVDLRARAMRALLELPDHVGLVSLRDLAPQIGQLRQAHDLNILGMEALAAAMYLGATVHLSASAPRLEVALGQEGVRVDVRSIGP
jgi:hypothetical protein